MDRHLVLHCGMRSRSLLVDDVVQARGGRLGLHLVLLQVGLNEPLILGPLSGFLFEGIDKVEQFDLKHQDGIGRNFPTRTPRPVGQIRGNEEFALAPLLQQGNRQLPALDDAPQGKSQGRSPLDRRVNDRSVEQTTGVVYFFLVAPLGMPTGTRLFDDVVQALGRRLSTEAILR